MQTDDQGDDLPQRATQGLTDPQMSMNALRAATYEAQFRTSSGERAAAGMPPVSGVRLFTQATARGDQWSRVQVMMRLFNKEEMLDRYVKPLARHKYTHLQKEEVCCAILHNSDARDMEYCPGRIHMNKFERSMQEDRVDIDWWKTWNPTSTKDPAFRAMQQDVRDGLVDSLKVTQAKNQALKKEQEALRQDEEAHEDDAEATDASESSDASDTSGPRLSAKAKGKRRAVSPRAGDLGGDGQSSARGDKQGSGTKRARK